MMRNLIILRVLLILCVGCVAIWYGCNGGNGNDGNGNDGESEAVFVTSLYVLDSNGQETSEFYSGEEIQFELNIMNTSSSPQTLGFPSSHQYDFFVRQAGTSNIIWRWSHNLSFAQMLTTLTFESGETKSFTELWVQTDNDEILVGPGLYEAQGIIVGREESDEFRSSWVAFEIL